MKVAPVLAALRSSGHDGILVHTGQHYDARMSDAFFVDLDIPQPAHHLGVGAGSHALQTARVMEAFEPVLISESPDWVIVVGDINSTLACSLVTAKLKVDVGCRLAHVEAGLRSSDWTMPEEVNRVLTDHVADLLLTPSHDAKANLLREGIEESRIVFVGNVMIDTLLKQLPAARAAGLAASLGLVAGGYAVCTLHRPSNVDSSDALKTVLEALGRIAEELPVVLPLHPRTRDRIEHFGLQPLLSPLRMLDPLGYIEMLSLIDTAAIVLTDSGGVQEETTVLGVPCVTLREQTERPITIEEGTNRLAPWPLSSAGVVGAASTARKTKGDLGQRRPQGWDGAAAERIVKALEEASVGRGGAAGD